MSLKIADSPKPGSLAATESWLTSLAKLAARLAAPPPPRTQNDQA